MQEYTEIYRGIERIPTAERIRIIAFLDSPFDLNTILYLPSVDLVGVEVVAAVIKNIFKSDATLSFVIFGIPEARYDWWSFKTPLAYDNDDRPHRLEVMHSNRSIETGAHIQTVVKLLADAIETDRHFTHLILNWSLWNSKDNENLDYTIGQALRKAPRLSALTLEGPILCHVAEQLGLSSECQTWTNTQILEQMWRPWREGILLAFAVVILPDDLLQLIQSYLL
jgi:hypothetical protein